MVIKKIEDEIGEFHFTHTLEDNRATVFVWRGDTGFLERGANFVHNYGLISRASSLRKYNDNTYYVFAKEKEIIEALQKHFYVQCFALKDYKCLNSYKEINDEYEYDEIEFQNLANQKANDFWSNMIKKYELYIEPISRKGVPDYHIDPFIYKLAII